MRILHISACGLGRELEGPGKVGRDLLSSLGDACTNSHQISRFRARGGENQLLFTSLFQFFTLAWVRSVGWIGDRLCTVALALRIVCPCLRKGAP